VDGNGVEMVTIFNVLLELLPGTKVIIDAVHLAISLGPRSVGHSGRKAFRVLHQPLAKFVATDVRRSDQHDWSLLEIIEEGLEDVQYSACAHYLAYLYVCTGIIERDFFVCQNFVWHCGCRTGYKICSRLLNLRIVINYIFLIIASQYRE